MTDPKKGSFCVKLHKNPGNFRCDFKLDDFAGDDTKNETRLMLSESFYFKVPPIPHLALSSL